MIQRQRFLIGSVALAGMFLSFLITSPARAGRRCAMTTCARDHLGSSKDMCSVTMPPAEPKATGNHLRAACCRQWVCQQLALRAGADDDLRRNRLRPRRSRRSRARPRRQPNPRRRRRRRPRQDASAACAEEAEARPHPAAVTPTPAVGPPKAAAAPPTAPVVPPKTEEARPERQRPARRPRLRKRPLPAPKK